MSYGFFSTVRAGRTDACVRTMVSTPAGWIGTGFLAWVQIFRYRWEDGYLDWWIWKTQRLTPGVPMGFSPGPRKDPLVLDLDGDGVKTKNISGDSVSFWDGNCDGFAEMAGWADTHDGVLAMDRNGNGIIDNGKELFGDQTILKSGKRAANGFEALAEVDSNGDGKIDANDAAFSQLRIITLNESGNAYKLCTLDEMGIKSINLDSTVVNTTDPQGNTESRVGNFEMADGSIRQIAEYRFQRDPMITIATEWLPEPDDIAGLPDLPGVGTVLSLHQAMVRDTSGALQSLVDQFVNTNEEESRIVVVNRILLNWTDSEYITDSRLRFANYDNHKIQILEKIFGEPFTIEGEGETDATQHAASFVQRISGGSGVGAPQLTEESIVYLNELYSRVFECVYGMLMLQTHLDNLYGQDRVHVRRTATRVQD